MPQASSSPAVLKNGGVYCACSKVRAHIDRSLYSFDPHSNADRTPNSEGRAGTAALSLKGSDVSPDYSKIITIDPSKRGGKPCIRGLRITVYDVLEYLASGMSEDDILADFPDLERNDIRASLAFAADRGRYQP